MGSRQKSTKRITLVFILFLLFTVTPLTAFSKLSYTVSFHNSDNIIFCNLLFIRGHKAHCRQGRGLVVYDYSAINKVIVQSNEKEFSFEKELASQKEQLAAAFDNINEKELSKLRILHSEREKYYAEMGIAPPDPRIYKGSRQRATGKTASGTTVETLKDKIKKEHHALMEMRSFNISECYRSNDRIEQKESCAKSARTNYRRKIAELKADPEYYFEKKKAQLYRKKPKRPTPSDKEDNERPGIITSADGETLHRSGSGYIGPDGTYYNDTAGGVINSETGEFTPVH